MNSFPKFVKDIEINISNKLSQLKITDSELLDVQQVYCDKILEIYQDAFNSLIGGSKTFSKILNDIKYAYESAIQIRNERISHFITQDFRRMSTSDGTPTVLVLDGGFSSQLSRHVGTSPDGDPLWCSKFLQTNPEGVYKAHLDYLRAGSDVIETNTYQASVGAFVRHLGVTPEEGRRLIIRAVELVKRARDTYIEECKKNNQPIRKIYIAGSCGPYGAHLHDGSEYDGSYADKISAETMREWHKPRIEALIEAGVDFLAIETLPCAKEAEVLVEMLKDYPQIKAWLSFSCKDENSLANGDDYKTTVKKCWAINSEQLLAIGVNCCPPNIVNKLFSGINDGMEKPIPFITYPNSGEKYRPVEGWVGKDQCEPLADFVQEWLDLGVRYIGSCCRTCDVDITQIKDQVQIWLKNKSK